MSMELGMWISTSSPSRKNSTDVWITNFMKFLISKKVKIKFTAVSKSFVVQYFVSEMVVDNILRAIVRQYWTCMQGCQIILSGIRNDFCKSRDLEEEVAQYLRFPFHVIFCLF